MGAVRLQRFSAARKCSDDLRTHSAELLYRATNHHAPHVGAALGVGGQRVRNMITGEAANPLEILKKWHDELELRQVDGALLDDIAREVARWRRCGLAPETFLRGTTRTVRDEAATAALEIGEALFSALSRAKSAEEKVREINQAVEAMRRLALSCEREGLAAVKTA